jgi:hypothetical protein
MSTRQNNWNVPR